MGRLLQTQRRGKGKAGIESADRSPAHQRQNRILREPREIQERQTRQECRHRRHVQAVSHLTFSLHSEAVQQRPIPLLLHRHYPEIPSGIHRLSGTARHRKW